MSKIQINSSQESIDKEIKKYLRNLSRPPKTNVNNILEYYSKYGAINITFRIFYILSNAVVTRILALSLIVNIFNLIYLIINHKKEPYFTWRIFLQTFKFRTAYYPNKKYNNFLNTFQLSKGNRFKYINRGSDTIAYPTKWSSKLIIRNFNAIMNEFSEEMGNKSPHQYIGLEEIDSNWVVYDIGTAEGYQSKIWSKKVKHIVIFEPDNNFYEALKETFKQEITTGRVTVINIGASNRKKQINFNKGIINLDTLDNIVDEYGLPLPNYIKMDVEGEEINLFKGAERILNTQSLSLMEVTTYHRPNDFKDIPLYLSKYPGAGVFSDGVMIFNRDGMKQASGYNYYTPIIRKCLYRYTFDRQP
ncbi:MAG: FkbM family methyltransferase [Bacteroidetes bacterium]|nr:FkbM family methyltransferase [Bacteroidota bacterium]